MLKRSTSKNPKEKAKREDLIIRAHIVYIELADYLIDRVIETIFVIFKEIKDLCEMLKDRVIRFVEEV
ncbi:MAG: hypothetical protein SWO11_09555 [Thermodesulfobacteriota bacterium]|nr:hypothetical protein [Thermodesulfobacteriota bacterium]